MARTDPEIVYDGYGVISDGVDSKTPPQLLARTALAWASNISLRDNLPQCRPGWVQRPLSFTTRVDASVNPPVTLPSTTVQSEFESGLWQGAIGFERARQLVCSIAGRLYCIYPDTWLVTDITPIYNVTSPDPRTQANPGLSRAWFAEAEDFIIRQDGQSAPWIYDGGTTRPADSAGQYGPKEVPGGTAMCYSQGRLVVATSDGRSFVVGDIVGSTDSGTPQYSYRDSVLRFTENDIIAQGGSFAVPVNAGNITAIRPVAQVDTSLGQGPTQIFTATGIFSLNTPSDRTTWKTVNYPIQTFSVIQAGSSSDRATVNVNGDIWVRALDGVRSFQVARRDWGTWINTPQSLEVTRALRYDDPTLLEYSSSALFDNRLLMTTRPYRVQGHGVVHQGFVSLDFAPVARLGGASQPVWEGVWSGLQVLQVLSVNWGQSQRCFIFSLSTEDKIQLWEVTREGTSDQPLSSPSPIQWSYETGGYAMPDSGFNEKKLVKAWAWTENIQGDVTVAWQWRANGTPQWRNWHQIEFCATMESCNLQECEAPSSLQPQTRRPWLLPDATPTCDTPTDTPSNIGEWFQVRVVGTGYARLPRLLVAARETQQPVNLQTCTTVQPCRVANVCSTDGFDYQIET